MTHETRTYFKELAQDDVKGFIILSVSENEYFIGEKWLKADGPDQWHAYSVPQAQIHERTKAGDCKPVGKVSQEQFDKVVELTGYDADTLISAEA